MVDEITLLKNSQKHSDSPNDTFVSGSNDYFNKSVIPLDIKAITRVIKAPTSYVNNGDQTFIFVRSGNGKIVINGLDYKLKANTLLNLGPFHSYRFLPSKGSQLELTEAHINSGTYVYMIANPYLKMENFYVPSEPPIVYLSGLMAEIAKDSMDGLLQEMEKKGDEKMYISFCYIMDLVGIVTEKMPTEYFRKG